MGTIDTPRFVGSNIVEALLNNSRLTQLFVDWGCYFRIKLQPRFGHGLNHASGAISSAPLHVLVTAPVGPCLKEDPPVDGVFLDMGSAMTAISMCGWDVDKWICRDTRTVVINAHFY